MYLSVLALYFFGRVPRKNPELANAQVHSLTPERNT